MLQAVGALYRAARRIIRSMTWKWFFIGVGAIVLACLLILVAFMVHASREASRISSQPRFQLPKELQEARVVTGEAAFHKDIYYKDAELGNVSDIQQGRYYGRDDLRWAIVGNRGADFLGDDRILRRTARFHADLYCPIILADLDSNGNPGFLNRDETWFHDVMYFDPDGRRRWKYGKFIGVDDSAVGDVKGDGKREVVVGFNGEGGIHLLDSSGKKLWERRSGNVWHVEVVDVDLGSAGRAKIAHSDASGQIILRDAQGNVLAHHRPEIYVGSFALTRWGRDVTYDKILVPGREELYVFSLFGDTLQKLEAPLAVSDMKPVGTPIRFSSFARAYAALLTRQTWNRSILYFFDDSGRLLYEEVIAENCGALQLNPLADHETLLVGCDGKILEYSVTPPTKKPGQGLSKGPKH
jgi:hypothetical protein